MLRLGAAHAARRPPRRRRPALHELPRDPHVLPDAGVVADRPQPAPGRSRPRRPLRLGLSRLRDGASPPTCRPCPRCSARPGTPRSWSASGTCPKTPTSPRPGRATRGRVSAASTATTACSTPSPICITRIVWCATTAPSRSRSTPRATTSPTTSPIGRSTWSPSFGRRTRTSRSCSTSLTALCTHRCMPAPKTSRPTAADSTRDGMRCASAATGARSSWASSIPRPGSLRATPS
jgi:hypothetical protein